MKFSSITIEGNILSTDLLSKIEDGSELTGQTPADFGFETGDKVSDAIQRAWGMASDQWKVFKERRESLDDKDRFGTTLVRRFWIEPLLDLLGHNPEYERKAEEIMNRPYPISHRDLKRGRFPIHIVGFQDKELDAPEKRSTLDVKPSSGTSRMSPHAMVQEYLNLTEHLYAIVTNGLQLRVLRDSSRLVKLSFIEFNLEQMMEEGHFSDFRLLYRLVHASRMPVKEGEGSESLFEAFHQESLVSGESIRDGLGMAVEDSILQFANGLLQHPENRQLRELIEDGRLNAKELYRYILRLIYRLLFLMVIEERNLVFTRDVDTSKRDIYYKYYSVNRLRKLAESNIHADKRFTDYWEALKNTFRLYEKEHFGSKLSIKPLGGDLFGPDGIGYLHNCTLDNQTLLQSLKRLGLFHHKETRQLIRVNYANLNVEEFGSVYEGLLEYDPVLVKNGQWIFDFDKGDERSKTGSHYTPDELVQPLIKHSLDHQILDRVEEPEKFISVSGIEDKAKQIEQALLDLRVADVACGSGHILLSAARRIGLELARVRTGEDQPSPEAMRKAIRDAICNCVYGVDKNPMAVELCKVALWLEAHNPGEPLNFLDHQIKCGDAIVGMAHFKELMNGVPDEAFKKTGDDDKTVASTLRKANKKQRKTGGQLSISEDSSVVKDMSKILTSIEKVSSMPEHTPQEIKAKKSAYEKFVESTEYWHLKTLADIPVSQFFIPKTQENKAQIITEQRYRQYLSGNESLEGQAISKAQGVAADEHFFHWFLEFPEVMQDGGFDSIIGNPPFLGGKKISGSYGDEYLNWLKFYFHPAKGGVDLVAYFFRRVYSVIIDKGFLSLISTNTISQGDTRIGGLEVITKNKGEINHAVKSMKWPGKANVEVALVTIFKGDWEGDYILENDKAKRISTYLDSQIELGTPLSLNRNNSHSFQGSVVLGAGFVLSKEKANDLINNDPKNRDVVYPYLNGSDVNKHPEQKPSRCVINFKSWPLRRYSDNEWGDLDLVERKEISENINKGKFEPIVPPSYSNPVAKDYPDCLEILKSDVKPQREKVKRKSYRERWWQFAENAVELYKQADDMDRLIVAAKTTKYAAFSFAPTNIVYTQDLTILTYDTEFILGLFSTTFFTEWVWKFSTTMGSSGIRLNPSSCFETYPLPSNVISELKEELKELTKKYVRVRQEINKLNGEGFTKTYNRFHDKNEDYYEINYLRKLQVAIDKTVLDLYGVDNINLRHDFYKLSYLPEDDNLRYTIHPEAREEILEILFKLNHSFFEQEILEGLHKKKDVEAYYKQKGETVPAGTPFSDRKTNAKPKKKSKNKVEEPKVNYRTLFDQELD